MMLKIFDKLLHKHRGVALGGGGARGAAHIGALQALHERDISIECVSGTSGGAIIAVLYAFGLSFDEIKKEVSTLKSVELKSFKFRALGLVENTPLIEMLKRTIGANAKIEDAKIPLAIHTSNIQNGEGVTLLKGPVKEALLASCCVPAFYIPQEIDGQLLVDGGLTENVPLSALQKLSANFTFAVNLNGNFSYSRPENILDVATNALDMAIDVRTKEQIKNADVSFNLSLNQFSRKKISQMDQLIKAGYEQTQERLNELLGKAD